VNRTQGGCTLNFGTGQHALHIVFRSLKPGEKFEGEIVQAPPEGVIGEPTFKATADPDGVARVAIDVQRIGQYGWVAEASDGEIAGEFFVAPGVLRDGSAVCAGPPP
jgi:hypothetical protein